MAHRHTASRLVTVQRSYVHQRTISCSGQSLP
ncbi:hypothetical protein QS626_25925, partial [Escherichia coli]|nr:hypothetical protein [Escherichia coli]